MLGNILNRFPAQITLIALVLFLSCPQNTYATSEMQPTVTLEPTQVPLPPDQQGPSDSYKIMESTSVVVREIQTIQTTSSDAINNQTYTDETPVSIPTLAPTPVASSTSAQLASSSSKKMFLSPTPKPKPVINVKKHKKESVFHFEVVLNWLTGLFHKNK